MTGVSGPGVAVGGTLVTLAGTGRVGDDLFLMAHDEVSAGRS